MTRGLVIALISIPILIFLVGNVAIYNFYEPQRMSGSLSYTVSQVKTYLDATRAFKEMYHALPGDMPDAGKFLTGCTGKNGADCNPHPDSAGDGIVGNLDLSKSWKAQISGQTHVPAASAMDETVLFWTHLLLANTIGGVTDASLKSTKYQSGITHPEAKLGGVFVAATLDGLPFPKPLSPKSTGIKGLAVIQVSDAALRGEVELNDVGQQPLTPLRAAQIDRNIDDGRAGTGLVQAYGSPDCFGPGDLGYNESSKEKSCGLIFSIEPRVQ